MADRLKPRRKPRQARSAVTVDAMLVASRKVLVEHGYAGFTTERVAAVAGVSIGSLYEYFSSKDALLSELVEDFFRRMMAAALAAVDPALAFEPGIRRVIAALLAAKAGELELNAVLAEEMPRVDGAKRLEVLHHQLQSMVAAYLARFSAEIPALDVDLAAFVLVHAIMGVLSETVRTRRSHDERLVDELTALCVGYVRAPRSARDDRR
jgi:AcrR family transcriptional regulator